MERFTLFCVISAAVIGLTSGTGLLPDIVNASLGGSVTFTPSLNQSTEHPFTTIIWTFGAVNVITHSASSNITNEQYEDRITLFTSTGSLELRNLAESDAGDYFVTIVTAAGGVFGSAILKLYEKIDNSVIKPVTPPVEGSSVNLTCEASGSNPTREWKFNGIELTPTGNVQFYDEKRVLSFTSLTRNDNGKYTCNISNPVSSQTADYTMKVNYGPENIKISGPTHIEERKTLTLSCSSDSEPTAKYTWIKNGATVGQSSEYTKNKISTSDGGEYICQAKNEITMKSFEASHAVNVTELPKEPENGLSAGAIAGITVASLAVVVGAAAGGYNLYQHKKDRKEKNNRREPEHIYENTSNTGNCNTNEENKHVYENCHNEYDRKL